MTPHQTSFRLNKRSARQLLNFLHLAENLKNEIRHSQTSTERPESVAEHSWRTVLIAVLLKNYLGPDLNWERLLAMIVVHDLAEARTGDVPIFERRKRGKQKKEERSVMTEFRSALPSETGEWLYGLWEEFESNRTNEAKIANALDKLEAQVQHNEANLKHWIEWEKLRVFGGLDAATDFNNSIKRFKNIVIDEAVKKLIDGGEDIIRLRANANGSKSVKPKGVN